MFGRNWKQWWYLQLECLPIVRVVRSRCDGSDGSHARRDRREKKKKTWEQVEDFTGQVAHYDDGVGTQENKLIRAISGGMGVGLRKNVVQLYAALLHQYEPGDRIFLFGFSRGAFTVRVFANLLFQCGIADAFEREDNDDRDSDYEDRPRHNLKTPNEINALAEMAVAHYEKRVFCDPFKGADPIEENDVDKDKGDGSPNWFRRKYGLQSTLNVQGERGWFSLHFVGVWDTVEAYGLPIDELSDAFTWLFPLRFIQQGPFRENDLHPLIDNAYHAVAIDDERHSFHPKMWIESEPLDIAARPLEIESESSDPVPPKLESESGKHPMESGKSQSGKSKVIYGCLGDTYSEGIRKVERNPNQKVEQVWFAGMHSNVGGGYPKDQLAHVSLNWMIEKAEDCGLRFEELAKTRCKDADDANGKMYDSRSGFSVVYRYRPRNLTVLCADGGLQKPMIHSSVLQRIHRHTEDYAPTGIPQQYDIVYPQPNKYEEPDGNNSTLNVIRDVDADRPEIADPFEETEPGERAEIQQVLVDFLIWQRRVLYVVFIVGLLTLIATASIVAASPSDQFDIEDRGWGSVSRFVYFLAAPVVEIVVWAVPAYLEPGVVGLGRHPVLLVGFAVVALLVLMGSRVLKSKIVQKSNEAWAKGFGKPEYEPWDLWAHLKKVVKLLGTLILIKRANEFRQNPTINRTANWFQRSLLPRLLLAGVVCAILFTLWNWFAPPITDFMYRSEVTERLPEAKADVPFNFDTKHPFAATPVMIESGQIYSIEVSEDGDWKDKDIPADAGGVDKPSHVQNLIGFTKRVSDQPWFKVMASVGPREGELIPIGKKKTFMAKTSGRLYLFVNDAYGFYGNNEGTAKVTVTKFAGDTPEKSN